LRWERGGLASAAFIYSSDAARVASTNSTWNLLCTNFKVPSPACGGRRFTAKPYMILSLKR